jgi:hypothetical protein
LKKSPGALSGLAECGYYTEEGGVMVGRFQVMALLQAARAKVLGYPLDEAQSFGLNRAIFYAAAKRGFMRRCINPGGMNLQKHGQL